jgi:hypothetical protein
MELNVRSASPLQTLRGVIMFWHKYSIPKCYALEYALKTILIRLKSCKHPAVETKNVFKPNKFMINVL